MDTSITVAAAAAAFGQRASACRPARRQLQPGLCIHPGRAGLYPAPDPAERGDRRTLDARYDGVYGSPRRAAG